MAVESPSHVHPGAPTDPDVAVQRSERAEADRRSADLLERIRHPRGFGSHAPQIAGLVVGIMATIALLSSIFPFFRHWIHVPRDYVDDFIISMPDTSFAWSFVLALVAIALTARKRTAWWICVIYLLLFMAGNACLLYTSPSPRDLSTSRMPSSA